MNLILPPPLQSGDRIGIAAPASPFDRLEFEKGVQTLQDLGFAVYYRDDIFEKNRYLAGNDMRRASELAELFANPSLKAILFARGGYGTQRILPLLDADLIRRNPKVVIGYSDLTSLLLYLQKKCSWIVFHGPVVAKGLGDGFQERGKSSLWKALTRSNALGPISTAPMRWLKPGVCTGVLTGGCLSLVIASLKTDWEIETEGRILFLEDANEKPYQIDRMLTHLLLAGKLEGVRGIIFGPLHGARASESDIHAVIFDVFQKMEIPILYGFPAGHLDDMLTIPLGMPLEMSSEKKMVHFLEGSWSSTAISAGTIRSLHVSNG